MKKGILTLVLAGLLLLLPACGESTSDHGDQTQLEYLGASSGQAVSILEDGMLDTPKKEDVPTFGQSTGDMDDTATGGETSAEENAAASSKIELLPHFSFTQNFPLAMNYKSASFLILNAAISDIVEENGKVFFALALTIQRQEDTLAGEKNFAVRIKWHDQEGNQIHITTASTTAAAIGDSGYGASMIAVDSIKGDYWITFEELQ